LETKRKKLPFQASEALFFDVVHPGTFTSSIWHLSRVSKSSQSAEFGKFSGRSARIPPKAATITTTIPQFTFAVAVGWPNPTKLTAINGTNWRLKHETLAREAAQQQERTNQQPISRLRNFGSARNVRVRIDN